MLNRLVTWESWGIIYEADPRHAEIIISELGLQDARPVATPGETSQGNRASDLNLDALYEHAREIGLDMVNRDRARYDIRGYEAETVRALLKCRSLNVAIRDCLER